MIETDCYLCNVLGVEWRWDISGDLTTTVNGCELFVTPWDDETGVWVCIPPGQGENPAGHEDSIELACDAAVDAAMGTKP